VKKVRILGETLALFRGDDGTLGLVADRCPHRGASLSCAMTDGGLIRCAYHAWAFDRSGQCVDTPAEPPESKLKNRIKIVSYEVQELGGLIWAYLGRSPAPLLPRFEHVVREDLVKRVGFTEIPCNWLQISENNVDPLHLEYLHMRYINWVRARRGEPPLPVRKHARIEFEIFEYGILKKRLWEGDSEDSQEWQVGHPLFFPGNHFFRFDTADMVQYQFRVPADDEQTNVYWYEARELNSGEAPTKEIPIVDNPWRTPEGEYMLDTINGQDMMVMVTQGTITDHTLENLAESDRGVALYRKTLLDEIERVERGEDPMGVVRDPAKNTPFIQLPKEEVVGYVLTGVQNSVNSDYRYK
jgi:5,5'-dehydrodivanillate O-demethylase oxygenase subunit